MTDLAHAAAQLARLSAAFPTFKMSPPTQALYLEHMQKIEAGALGYAVAASIERGRRLPTIAELRERVKEYAPPVRHELRAPEEGLEWHEPVPIPGRRHVVQHNVIGGQHSNCSRMAGEEWDEAEIIGPDGKRRGLPNALFERARNAARDHADGARLCCDEGCGCRAARDRTHDPVRVRGNFASFSALARAVDG
jgi:hypothetical protein